ncbi:MAG: hypothetical protein M1828_003243 [Chrysothrix sp. TS-e1954]|nr:MAG: hypothetical protein M1828_003243 [Chrysothrix sp. TS-e1954]
MAPKRPRPEPNGLKHEESADDGAPDYEAQRQANIARNQALLQNLQMDAASAGLAPNKSRPIAKPSTTRSRKPATRVQQQPVAPTRTSTRLKGIAADSEVAKRKADEEHAANEEAARAKRRRVADDLKLGDVVVAGEHWDQSGNWLRNFGPADPYTRTFDNEAAIKNTDKKELRELREKFQDMDLWEGVEPARIKITPERIYSMAFHPSKERALVFAGDKLGDLGMFDGSQPGPGGKVKHENGVKHEEQDEDDAGEDEDFRPKITSFKVHTRTISSIHFTPSQPQSLYTSSYDSSIRKLDLTKGLSTEVYAPRELDKDDPVSGVSIPQTDPNLLYFATLQGAFGIHDTRTPARSRPQELLQLSDKKIGGFSIHPQQPHLLATASLDRTLKLFDLRSYTGKAYSERMPAILGEHESRLSVSHASFNAAGQIATSSYDDTVKIYDLPAAGTGISPGKILKKFEPDRTIPHNNQTGRWVTILKPQWQMAPAQGAQKFCIGNMNRFVDIYAGSGEQIAQLSGEGITAVPAVAVFHESMDWVAAGTASGKLALWM